jgi:hypothetical protein
MFSASHPSRNWRADAGVHLFRLRVGFHPRMRDFRPSKTYPCGSEVSDEIRAAVFSAQAQQALVGRTIAVCLWFDLRDGDLGPPQPSAVRQVQVPGAAVLSHKECANRKAGSTVALPREEGARPVARVENGDATKMISDELFVSGWTTLGAITWNGEYTLAQRDGRWTVADGPKP